MIGVTNNKSTMRIHLIQIPSMDDLDPPATPEEIEAAKPATDLLATAYMQVVKDNSGGPLRAGILTLATLVGDRVTAGLFWAGLHKAQWVTFHDPDTGEKQTLAESNPATSLYRITPLFNLDPSRLPAAITERKINS